MRAIGEMHESRSFVLSLSLHSFRFSAHLRAFTFIPFVYGIYFCLPLVFVRFVCVLSSHFISFSNGYCLLPKARKIIPVYSMTIIRSLLRFSHSNIRVLLLFVMGPSIVYVCLCVCVYTMENVFHSPALAPICSLCVFFHSLRSHFFLGSFLVVLVSSNFIVVFVLPFFFHSVLLWN